MAVTLEFFFFFLLICSEQTAGRQRESGSCFGELLTVRGGQPVSEHQKPLNSNTLQKLYLHAADMFKCLPEERILLMMQ